LVSPPPGEREHGRGCPPPPNNRGFPQTRYPPLGGGDFFSPTLLKPGILKGKKGVSGHPAYSEPSIIHSPYLQT